MDISKHSGIVMHSYYTLTAASSEAGQASDAKRSKALSKALRKAPERRYTRSDACGIAVRLPRPDRACKYMASANHCKSNR